MKLQAPRVYYKNLPRKRMSVGALLFNTRGEILIVKPTYKNGWSIPGGTVDRNESLRDACIREVREEINVALKHIRLLCVDYMPTRKNKHFTKDDNLQFIFYGGVLKNDELQKIILPPQELSAYKFLMPSRALSLLRADLRRRIPPCIKALRRNGVLYLERGKIVA